MFRGKESSNRIELSRLVEDLLNFGVLGSLRLWGWGGGWMGWGVVGGWVDGVGGGWGVPPTHAHACMVSMIISCKWPPPFRESLEIPYDVICHTCVRMHVHVCGVHPLTTLHPHPPTSPPPRGWTPGISQNSIALQLIEIFEFRLKI